MDPQRQIWPSLSLSPNPPHSQALWEAPRTSILPFSSVPYTQKKTYIRNIFLPKRRVKWARGGLFASWLTVWERALWQEMEQGVLPLRNRAGVSGWLLRDVRDLPLHPPLCCAVWHSWGSKTVPRWEIKEGRASLGRHQLSQALTQIRERSPLSNQGCERETNYNTVCPHISFRTCVHLVAPCLGSASPPYNWQPNTPVMYRKAKQETKTKKQIPRSIFYPRCSKRNKKMAAVVSNAWSLLNPYKSNHNNVGREKWLTDRMLCLPLPLKTLERWKTCVRRQALLWKEIVIDDIILKCQTKLKTFRSFFSFLASSYHSVASRGRERDTVVRMCTVA